MKDIDLYNLSWKIMFFPESQSFRTLKSNSIQDNRQIPLIFPLNLIFKDLSSSMEPKTIPSVYVKTQKLIQL